MYVFLLVLLLVITYRSWLKYFKFKARDEERLKNEALELELAEVGDVESKVENKKKNGVDSDDGVVVAEALRGYSPKTAKRKAIKRQLTVRSLSLSSFTYTRITFTQLEHYTLEHYTLEYRYTKRARIPFEVFFFLYCVGLFFLHLPYLSNSRRNVTVLCTGF